MSASIRAVRVTRLLAVGFLLTVTACGGADARKAAYLERGREFMQARNFEKARLEFRNALQIEPHDAETRFMAGQAAEKSGNLREAVQMYRSALDDDEGNVRARASLGRLQVLAGMADKALELVEPVFTTAPHDPDLLTVRGAARLQKGDEAGAHADAEEAVRLAPDNENAVALAAALHQKSGRKEESIALVERALEMRPKSVDLRIILAQLMLSAGRAAEAEQQLQEVITLEPEKLAHRYRLAQLQLVLRDVAGAETTLRQAAAAKPDDVQPKLALANLLAAHRSFDVAEKELRALSDRSSDDLDLRLALADFYGGHGKAERAEVVYREIIETDDTGPKGLAARNRIAEMHLRANRLDAAEKLLAEVLAINARDGEALTMRAKLALDRGQASAAIADLRAVLRDQPNSIPLQRSLARAHLQNDDAVSAEETLRISMQANPKDLDTRLELSRLLMQRGKHDQALPILEGPLSEHPGDLRVLEASYRVQVARQDLAGARRSATSLQTTRLDLPIGYYLAGLIDQAEKRPDAARRSFERALSLAPDAAEPLEALVRLDLALKLPEQAMERLDRVSATYPRNAFAHNLKGEILLSLHRPGEAAASFQEALRRAPEWWVPYRGLGLAALANKDQDGAIRACEDGIRATKGAAMLVADLAGLYERAGRFDDAIRQYQMLHEGDPRSDIAANNLAMLLVTYRSDRKSLDQAAALAKRFARSKNPAFLDTYGWVSFKGGESAAAVAALEDAVHAAPKSAALRYHLGMAQWKAGQTEKARGNLDIAVTSGVDFAGLSEARAALSQLSQ